MKVIIVGAGIAGLILAWWLAKDGWDVVVLERAPGPRGAGYAIDLFGSGYDVAERMGLLTDLRKYDVPFKAVEFKGPLGQSHGRLDYASAANLVQGRLFTILRGDLEAVLHEAVSKAPNINVRFRETIDAIEELPDGTVATQLRTGEIEVADLVVGADGIHSQVRQLILGDVVPPLRYLGYHTCAYLVDEPELLAMVGERCLMICAPGKQLALYPTKRGQLAAWLTHVSAEATIPNDPQATVRSEYADLIKGNGQEAKMVQRVLELCPEAGLDLYYDQVSQVELDKWSKGHVVLLGDACQAVSLMAGQGASMAMGSAWVLADELRKAKDNPVDAAEEYHRRLQNEIREIQKTGRTSARWLVPTANWQLLVRRIVFGITSFPWLGYLLQPLVAPFQKTVVKDSP
ncbi:hypothetical protein V494_03290 [Pseudogymnoascus sp. VKM F-4513 (FW-928)]|nr:hypothetical protein V494_03290 [Pseudogymnoascus sp. VKM F-4513 (FW-928)]